MSSVIESLLFDFKRELTNDKCSSVASAVKCLKSNDVELLYRGNKKQFEHQVLESLFDVKESLEKAKYDTAKHDIEQCVSLVEKRIKAITLTDRGEIILKSIYLTSWCSKLEDEKRIFRSERSAQRRLKQSSNKWKQRSSSVLSR